MGVCAGRRWMQALNASTTAAWPASTPGAQQTRKHAWQVWWKRPSTYFYVTSALFWGMVLLAVTNVSAGATNTPACSFPGLIGHCMRVCRGSPSTRLFLHARTLRRRTRAQHHLLGSVPAAPSSAERAALDGVACSPRQRRIATCAHRGNAGELLARASGAKQLAASQAAGAPGAAAAAAAAADPRSVLGQMQLLWQAGITCFDYDVVALAGARGTHVVRWRVRCERPKASWHTRSTGRAPHSAFARHAPPAGGELLVGHPSDLAAQLDAAALAALGVAASGGRAREQQQQQQQRQALAAALHTRSLQQLRAAGLGEDAAPTLPQVAALFQRLLQAPPPPATAAMASLRVGDEMPFKNLTAREAAAARLWWRVPLLTLELKGQAAASAAAWHAVVDATAAAGVASRTILWMRQAPPAAGAEAGGGTEAVTRVAGALRQRWLLGPSSQPGAAGAEDAAPPLLGLIVPDALLQQPHLAPLAAGGAAGDAAGTLTSALLATAGGLAGPGSPAGGAASPGAAATTASSNTVMAAFDVLAMSIKLPAGVFASALQFRPCMAWTLSSAWDHHKAVRLGLDAACSNTPLAQERALRQRQQQQQWRARHTGAAGGVCGARR
jgi:hypothetical protein